MPFTSEPELYAALSQAVAVDGAHLTVRDGAALRAAMPRVARTAVFAADSALRTRTQDLIRALARASGAWSASIQPLYAARGRGEVHGFTVPAVNVRFMTFDFARAMFRAADASKTGAFVFELARSEMGYTAQTCSEFSASVLAAAIAEGWDGPVFIQGDHYQANAARFAADPAKEEAALRTLIAEAIAAGYGNIDIDSSTLVDLNFPTVREQQRINGQLCARLTQHVRALEPAGMPISIGGEIGEVGHKNSTPEELRAFMAEFEDALGALAPGTLGLSKVSVQTGTSHGGIPTADGSVAAVKLDFEVLRELSVIARQEFGMCGAVQHGASTLPDDLFHTFPAMETGEIHLATGFQNQMYDHPAFPAALKADIYAWLDRECAAERKDGETDEQFHYKTRKKAAGPFKRTLWDLPAATRDALHADLEAKFRFFFDKLQVSGTRDLVNRLVTRDAAHASGR